MEKSVLSQKVIIKNLKKLYKEGDNFEGYSQYIGGTMDEILVKGYPKNNRGRIRNDQPDSGAKDHFEKVMVYILVEENRLSELWEETLTKWKDSYLDSDKEFFNCISDMLEDPEIEDCNNDDVQAAFAGIKKIIKGKRPFNKEIIFKILTMLTIFSYTRHFWSKIAEKLIGLVDLKEINSVPKQSEIEAMIEAGQDAWNENDMAKALDIFIIAKKQYIDADSSATLNEKGKICFYLYLITFQEYLKLDVRTKKKRAVCREYLLASSKMGYVQALSQLAKEYYEPLSDSVVNPDIRKCCECCQCIVKNHSESPEAKDAYWYLYKCSTEDTGYQPPEGESAELYLKYAAESGHREARELFKKLENVSFTTQLEPSETDQSKGICYFNEYNCYSDTVIGTKPITWEYKYDYSVKEKLVALDRFSVDEMKSHLTDIADIRAYINNDEKRCIYIFFISDSFHKNLTELLSLLQNIKDTGTNVLPETFRIYIRADEVAAAPIIDTALARMNEYIIPVYIIDDDKRAANVLAYHPLFFPVRNVPVNGNVETYLHYIIIGNTKGCEWLLKEAYWMLTFRNLFIKTKITVVGPNIRQLYESIMYQCPDLEKQNDTMVISPGLDKVNKKAVITIEFEECDYHSSVLIDKVRPLLSEGNVYFSIDTGNDMQNYLTAIRMREESIRNINPVKTPERFSNLPVITYRCFDSDIAYLSYNAVVYNQNSGRNWYNNYEILPYGMITEMYGWSSLVDDCLENMGYCCHLQYSGINTDNINEEPEKLSEAQRSYYGKTYNRDSSVCVAKSISYRLFQCHYPDNVKQGLEHILPSQWKIREKDAFFSKCNREYFASLLYGDPNNRERAKDIDEKEYRGSQLMIDDWGYAEIIDSSNSYGEARHITKRVRRDETKKGPYMRENYDMAEWEHRRWKRYMISRGWCAGEKEEALEYYKQGNERQQLYIAKVHPALIEFSKVQALNNYMLANTGNDYKLVDNDISSIQMTESILKMDLVRIGR